MTAEEQTLTMDETTPESGQFSEEEMDSLKVGESMQEAQDQRLAGKYENAQELEKAYIELEKKIGEKNATESSTNTEEKAEETTEEKADDEEAVSVLDKLWDERDAGFSDETLTELAKTNPGELAKLHLRYRAQQLQQEEAAKGLSDDDISELKGLVGGEQDYQGLIAWAETSLTKDEQNMYDTVMDRGDKLACYFAVQALMARYKDAVGTDGKLIQGKPPSSGGNSFRSQAELVKAMSDPRYERDPAYRADIQEKLQRSDVNF